MDNKALWVRAFTTDPRAVKPITGKQYKGNSPKPYWIIERLTDEFGPCGLGWGFTILSERFERFGDAESLHIAVVRLWYVMDGQRGEFEQVGQTRSSYMSAAGKFIVDEDAPKKSVTDALVKCASYLGFAGDIFSGMWDDSKYVAHADAHWREREAEEDPQRAAWLEGRKAAILGVMNMGELKRVLADAIQIAMDANDSSAVDQLNAWAEEKRSQAKPKAVA